MAYYPITQKTFENRKLMYKRKYRKHNTLGSNSPSKTSPRSIKSTQPSQNKKQQKPEASPNKVLVSKRPQSGGSENHQDDETFIVENKSDAHEAAKISIENKEEMTIIMASEEFGPNSSR